MTKAPSKKERDERAIFSTRLLPELAQKIDIEAAIEGRYMYELVEEALMDYLAKKAKIKHK